MQKNSTLGIALVTGVLGLLLGGCSPHQGPTLATSDATSSNTGPTHDEWARVVQCETLRNQGTANPDWRKCMIDVAPKTRSWENAMVLAMSAAAWLEQRSDDLEIKQTGRALISTAWSDLAARKGSEQQAWFIDQAELMIEAPAVYKTQSERRLRMFPPPPKTWKRLGSPN